jgi:uncharacterized membrane protein YidH (DUF202 family)
MGLWMVSVFNLMGIAVLRCYAINYPTKAKNKGFQHCCTIVPITGWVLTLIFFLRILTHKYGQFGVQCKKFSCIIINVDPKGNPITPDPTAIYFLIIIFSGIIMVFLNILCYVQVYKQSQKLFNQLKNTSVDEAKKVLRNEKRLQKMVGLITASFVLVYVPMFLVLVVFPSSGNTTRMISFFFAYLLVVIDPFVYIYSCEKFRKEIRVILNSILPLTPTTHPSDTTKKTQVHIMQPLYKCVPKSA